MTRIEPNTFDGSGLEVIVIPDGVTTIEYNAFAACESLVRVTIPKSVTTIAGGRVNGAFADCTNLKIVKVPSCSWHHNPLYDFDDGVTLEFPGGWSEWTVVEPATTTEEGMEQRTCTCGYVENRVIPKLAMNPT